MTDNTSMDNSDAFKNELYSGIAKKIEWYDSVQMPAMLSEYRLMNASVANLITTLEKKGTITADPYKNDKKLLELKLPEDGPFLETERTMVMGTRLSDYETNLDFICNYLKFSIETINVEIIKKLLALNNFIQWNSVATHNNKSTTRGLAECLVPIRQSSDTLSIGVINDGINQISKCVLKINGMLKQLTDFQREVYKVEVRKKIQDNPAYSKDIASKNNTLAMQQIKRLFPSFMSKRPFYSELIEEILAEDLSADKEIRQATILEKLEITKEDKQETRKEINTKELLMDAIRSITSVNPQLEQIITKLNENKAILDSEKNTFSDKLMALLRKAFNIEEKPVVYRIFIEEPLTHVKKQENIVFQNFLSTITKKIHFYASFSTKKTPGYEKIEKQSNEKILNLLNEQILDCQKLLIQLEALDAFFKNEPTPLNKTKIKGIKMEMTSIKNTLVKTNQRKADYCAIIEEQEQLKKLGIIHD